MRKGCSRLRRLYTPCASGVLPLYTALIAKDEAESGALQRGPVEAANVACLGLLPVPKDGLSHITDLYIARYGEPRPEEKVFIAIRQQKDGWEGDALEASDIVPENPAELPAAVTLTLIAYMHKECTGG